MVKYRNFEVIRLGIGKYLKAKESFSIYRVDPPYKPITNHGFGKRMGGGKGSIEGYGTPVRAGRIIVEVGGKLLWDEEEGRRQPWAQHQQSAFHSIYVQNIHHIHGILRDHNIHGTSKHQHQPLVQPHAFHSIHIHIQDHVHSIQARVRSIHHTEGRDQHQPLAQHHAFRSIHIRIQDHVHSIQGHVHSIHHTEGRGQHQPLAQHHAFRSIHIHILDHVHSIQDHVRSIRHTEGRDQHLPLV